MEKNADQHRSGCSKIFITCAGIFVIWLILAITGVYFLYKNLIKPLDLGVSYSREDFDALVNNIGIEIGPKFEDLCFNCPVVYEGVKKAEVKMTNEQASAWIDTLNSAEGVVRGTQVVFKDGQVELSTNFTYEGQSFPLYFSGSIEKAGYRSVVISLSDVKIGAVSIPQDYIPQVSSGLNEFVNSKLAEVEGLRINRLELREGYLEFEGTVPEKATGF